MRHWYKIAALLVSGAVLSLTQAGSAKEGKEDPAAILERAIKAHGGAEKLAQYKVQSWKAKGTLDLFGMKQDYTAEYHYQMPDKLRFDFAMEMGGMKVEITVVSDGKTAWEKAGPVLQEMEKDKFTEFKHNAYSIYLGQLLPLKDKKFTLTALPPEKLGERGLAGFKVSAKDKRDVSMFFDKGTGLLTLMRSRVFDEFAKKEVTQETIFDRYQDVEGRKAIAQMTIKRDGIVFLTETFTDQRVLDRADDKRFAKPAP